MIHLLGGWGSVGGAAVDEVFQFLTGFEVGDTLGGHFDASAGFGIAADASLALAGTKATETTDFDFVPCSERAHDAVEDRFDDHLRVFSSHFDNAGYFLDQIRFRHCGSILHDWQGTPGKI